MTKVNSLIDHTLLKAVTTKEQVAKLCAEAKKYQFVSVCIPPDYVSFASEQLSGSGVKVCTVIGFPLGYNKTSVKIFEAKEAIAEGAQELDYVLNICEVKNGNYLAVEKEMVEFVSLKAIKNDLVIKIILENCYLSEDEIVQICKLAKETGLDFVKTSTGFGTGGAEVEDVKLMRHVVGENVGVKASGGVRTLEDALEMVQAGATRIGTSNGVGMMGTT
jgi:deoxyribose-phosphate aldolase